MICLILYLSLRERRSQTVMNVLLAGETSHRWKEKIVLEMQEFGKTELNEAAIDRSRYRGRRIRTAISPPAVHVIETDPKVQALLTLSQEPCCDRLECLMSGAITALRSSRSRQTPCICTLIPVSLDKKLGVDRLEETSAMCEEFKAHWNLAPRPFPVVPCRVLHLSAYGTSIPEDTTPDVKLFNLH